MLAKAVWLMVLLLPMVARADRLGVAVREGPHDALILERLRGQLADLDVALTVDASTPEPTLDAQLASAEHIASEHGARVVVWFVPRGRAIEVAIATPAEHRLFIREIPPATDSTMAEAAAIAVRFALRAIAAGGTIGVELPAPAPHEPDSTVHEPPPPPPVAAPGFALEASLGWQAALDGGASPAAQALVQRTSLARGPWAASLALALGVPGTWRPAQDVALDVSRSGALLEIERRLGGGLAAGLGGGALLYHRSTTAAPTGLAPTPSASTPAFAATAELSWHAHLAHRLGFVVAVGVDVVAHAPAASLSRNNMVEVAGTIRAVQPRAAVALEVGSW